MMTCVQLRGHAGLGLLGVLFLAAHVAISQNSFQVLPVAMLQVDLQHMRTTPYDFTLQCFNLSCWILWFSLFFQNCEWETIASLALLNTAQNSVITAGLLAGTLYCGKLVVDGSLGVSTGNKIPAMCQGSKKQ